MRPHRSVQRADQRDLSNVRVHLSVHVVVGVVGREVWGEVLATAGDCKKGKLLLLLLIIPKVDIALKQRRRRRCGDAVGAALSRALSIVIVLLALSPPASPRREWGGDRSGNRCRRQHSPLQHKVACAPVNVRLDFLRCVDNIRRCVRRIVIRRHCRCWWRRRWLLLLLCALQAVGHSLPSGCKADASAAASIGISVVVIHGVREGVAMLFRGHKPRRLCFGLKGIPKIEVRKKRIME